MEKGILFLAFFIVLCSALDKESSSSTLEPSSSSTDSPVLPTSTYLPPLSSTSAFVTTSHGSASAVSTTPSISPSPTSFSPSPTSSMSPSPSESSSVPASSTPEPTPSSSSTYHPHSTPAPPPPTPYPHYVEFKLKNGSTTCFMMKGSIEFAISYKLKGSKKEKVHSVILPPNATVDGACANLTNTKPFLELKFLKLWTFTWIFNVKKDLSWNSANMTLSGSFMDGKEPVHVKAVLDNGANDKMFAAAHNHSYLCKRAEKVPLTNGVAITFNDIQVQPFTVTNGKFSTAITCPEAKKNKTSSDVVPIAVGCALAGLILIVLIAYLIGRRKTSNRGYEQV